MGNNLQFSIFSDFPQLRYGLSERKDGFMNIRATEDAEFNAAAERNRMAFLRKNKIDPERVFIPELAHGSEVAVVNENNRKERLRADGFVTVLSDCALVITEADCFPLYFYDPTKKVIGLAHAGWRGVVSGVAKNTVRAFVEHFASRPEDICLGIGPGIQKCHFTVRDDSIHRFSSYPEFIQDREIWHYVDLSGIIERQAGEAGVRDIETSSDCTYCLADKYFSYRRDKPAVLEVMMAYIGLRGD